MFVLYDCLWKLSIALLSVAFATFRIVEFTSASLLDFEKTKDLAIYSQAIHTVTALLFLICLLSRNTFITVLTIAVIVCQSLFTFWHYTHRECTCPKAEISFTGGFNTGTKCDNVDEYFVVFNRELFSIYVVAVVAVICLLCTILYVNHLEKCLEEHQLAAFFDENGVDPNNPKTSIVSGPSTWSGKREMLHLRSPRRDSGNFSA